MREGRKEFIFRKLKSTFICTFIFSITMSLFATLSDETATQLASSFSGFVMLYAGVTGTIVLIYGNLVSAAAEAMQQKWFTRADWLYVLLLGVSGSAIGLLFQETTLALFGFLVAVLYAIIDKWLLKKWQKNEEADMSPKSPLIE